MIRFFSLFVLLFAPAAFALPIDWQGSFGVDTTIINKYRRIDQSVDGRVLTTPGGVGSQEIALAAGGQSEASWQNYLFRLRPILIINDTATFKAEISSGYPRGGYFGDGLERASRANLGDALYLHNFTTRSDNDLRLNQFFVELYSDTSTYQIGRHSYHYGLGVIAHAGEGTWDRFSSVRDGLTLKVRLGNFTFSPFWARVGSGGSLTKSTNVKEYGVGFIYRGVERDVSFGLLYLKKSNGGNNRDIQVFTGGSIDSPTKDAIGEAGVKVTDFFFSKGMGDFTVSVEIPLMSGSMGRSGKYKAKAVVVESKYKVNDKWIAKAYGGQVSGDDGNTSDFGAAYLNPNYHVSKLMFRYNLGAVANPSGAGSIYDSYMTNTRYIKLVANYMSDKWVWDFGILKAWAQETASAGSNAFNHSLGRNFSAAANQSSDMGMELDVDFDYRWNNEVSVGGSFGYLMTGDYWAFTNDAAANNTSNSYAMQLRTSVHF